MAYMLSPTRGSEYSVGWNYVVNMSKDNELVVLYGASGNHLGDVKEIESLVEREPIKNVRFVAVRPDSLTKKLNILNEKNILNYSFYLAYNNWHKQVYKVAQQLIESEKFDLIHFLNPVGYREPGYLWKLDLPYIWGPIGGTNNVPDVLLEALPFKGKLKLGFRSLANKIQLKFSNRIQLAMQRTDVLMTATSENQKTIKRVFNKESFYLPENGIEGEVIKPNALNKSNKIVEAIWIGRIDANKALSLLLKALLQLKYIESFKLHVVGDGHLKSALIEFTKANNLDSFIVWHGAIPREKVLELLSKSQLHIITSVSEANTTVIWEAMSAGVPTLSLDHCGMHDTICEKCGIKIPIISYNQVISDIAIELDKLIVNPIKLDNLSNGVVVCAKKYNWESRRLFFNKMYDLAIEKWQLKQ